MQYMQHATFYAESQSARSISHSPVSHKIPFPVNVALHNPSDSAKCAKDIHEVFCLNVHAAVQRPPAQGTLACNEQLDSPKSGLHVCAVHALLSMSHIRGLPTPQEPISFLLAAVLE